MATGKITLDEGSTTNTATNTITEDAVTKHLPRSVINTSAGVEIDPLSESDFDTKIGSLTETAPATDTASSGVNGRLQRVAQRLTTVVGLLPGSLGQKARAASLAVTLSTEDVSALTPPAAITGFATEATLDARTGALTETAPATDTASSGLNGRMQRVAQRLTSLIALLPSSLGQKTKANSLAVALASDQDALPITDNGGSLTVDGTVDIGATSLAALELIGIKGADGSAVAANANPLPISDAGGSLTVDGTVAVTNSDITTVAGAVRAEDAASADGHTGIPALAVRKATPANTSGTDGDYEMLQLSAGRLWVDASGKTLTVDGSGVTQPVSAASLPLPSGAATAAKQPALGTAGSASADVISVQGVASMTALKVDGSAVTQPVSLASVPSHAVTNAGTFAVQATDAGDVAHDGADSGNPVKVGGQARTTLPTAVSDGDRANFITDKFGRQVTTEAIRDLRVTQQTTITSSTSETTILTAVASTFLDLYGLVITNTSATVCKVTIKDATAGTTRFVFEVPATETRGFMLPPSGAHAQAAVNNNWTATCGTSVAGIEITALAVKTA